MIGRQILLSFFGGEGVESWDGGLCAYSNFLVKRDVSEAGCASVFRQGTGEYMFIYDRGIWTGLIWLRIGTVGWHL